ncbi:sigma-70 family RNA polymerase sigma factor [Streptomyces hirsutus]
MYPHVGVDDPGPTALRTAVTAARELLRGFAPAAYAVPAYAVPVYTTAPAGPCPTVADAPVGPCYALAEDSTTGGQTRTCVRRHHRPPSRRGQ